MKYLILDKMDYLPFLNTNKRKQNVFGVFYNQNFKTIGIKTVPKQQETDNIRSDLVFLTKIPITNQCENMPKVDKDELKNVDLEVEKKTTNDEILSDVKAKSCAEDIDNNKPISKLEIKVDEVSVSNKSCDIIQENMKMPTLTENNVNIDTKAILKKNNPDVIVKKKITNNIFKRFRYK
jgi:hypothetical protein